MSADAACAPLRTRILLEKSLMGGINLGIKIAVDSDSDYGFDDEDDQETTKFQSSEGDRSFWRNRYGMKTPM